MPKKNTPSVAMYAQLKNLGISNRDAAALLLNTQLSFDGHTLDRRINDSSQLTRRVVHVLPGEIPVGMFNNFQIVCPQLQRKILAKLASQKRTLNEEELAQELERVLHDEGTTKMLDALAECNIDGTMFRNMVTYIDHAELSQVQDRSLLLLMLLVITGCTGNPQSASVIVVDYATNVLGADFHTAQTIINTPPAATQPQNLLLGLVRVVDGCIPRGAQMHVLAPNGTTLGLVPTGKHVLADVGEDASRDHARIWREAGRWFIQDLGSTNGTAVVSGTDGSTHTVAAGEQVEIAVADTICLGATTRFFVLPIQSL